MSFHGAAETIRVNGNEHALDAATVRELVDALGVDKGGSGIAVALNGEVVPRSEWERRRLCAGDEVDVVGAVQGG